MEMTKIVSKDEMHDVIVMEDPLRPCLVTEWAKTINGTEWHVKKDSTCGYEVASYKASGFMDIKNIGNVAEALRQRGCQVSEKCGLHVHADLSDHTQAMAGNLMAWWLKIESVVLQGVPAHRRNNQHCRMMRDKYEVETLIAKDPEGLYYRLEPTDLGDHNNLEKRVTLNFVPYAYRLRNENFKKCTAEIRFPEGSLRKEDIENWVRFYLMLVETSKTRKFPETLQAATLDETLQAIGLMGMPDTFYILSKDLFETKRWFLKRLLQFSKYKSIYDEALVHLNNMTQPEEIHYRARLGLHC